MAKRIVAEFYDPEGQYAYDLPMEELAEEDLEELMAAFEEGGIIAVEALSNHLAEALKTLVRNKRN